MIHHIRAEYLNRKGLLAQIGYLTLVLLLAAACAVPVACTGSAPQPTPTPVRPTPTFTPAPTATPTVAPTETRADDLSSAEAATLDSLEQVNDYPLYAMRYQGDYGRRLTTTKDAGPGAPAWACSLFAALGDADGMLYGRNFDWEYSPALLLRVATDPPDGYASVSMVDIAYLGFGGTRATQVLDLPLAERRALLYAPSWPFDGMNEHGLVVGMAAVPASAMPYDASKETIGSLRVIREMLDHARTVDEAVAILQRYNVEWGGGPPVHYLIADVSGRAVLVEFYQGEMVLLPNEAPWHLATNHLRAAADETGPSGCWRYDQLQRRLTETKGRLTTSEAMSLLAGVAQGSTQWSVVYEMSTGQVHVVMGRQYEDVHTFRMSPWYYNRTR